MSWRTRRTSEIEAELRKSEDALKRTHDVGKARTKRRTQVRLQARILVKRARALQKAAIFAHLDESAVGKILDATEYKQYSCGTVICKQGAAADPVPGCPWMWKLRFRREAKD